VNDPDGGVSNNNASVPREWSEGGDEIHAEKTSQRHSIPPNFKIKPNGTELSVKSV